MIYLSRIAQFFLNILRYHKFKIFFVFLSAIGFSVLIFPFDDLSDYVARRIAESTNNQVLVQFDHLSFDLFPQVGLGLTDVSVDTPMLPTTLKAGYLSVSPSLSSLLTFKMGVSAKLRDLFKGDVDLVLKSGGKTESGQPLMNLSLDVEDVALGELTQQFALPFPLRGEASLDASAKVDPGMSTQPEGELTLDLSGLELPASTVPTMLGPLSLPELKWKLSKLKGRLTGGRLFLDEASLGEAKDPLRGRFKGSLDLRLENRGGSIVPVFGAFDFKIELQLDNSKEREFSTLLGLLESHRTRTVNGSRFMFQVTGASFAGVPNIQGLSSF